MGEVRNTCNMVGKPEGKRPLGSPRRRWEDIRMYHLEVLCVDGKILECILRK
jgi:hypothetical protein